MRDAAQKRTKHRTLLLVNVDPLLEWSIRQFVAGRYEVVTVVTRDQALEAIRSEELDAIVVSDGLSDSGVRQIESEALTHSPNILRIRLTIGTPDFGEESEVVFLEKPFDMTALGAALQLNA